MSRGGYLLSVAGLTVGASPPELMDTRHWLAALLSCWAFLATQGVVFYDQRNSELYDSLIRRAKHIEYLLKLPRSPTAPSGPECGGQFSEGPERGKHYLGTSVLYGHDNDLALIYGAVQGAWFFPACLAVLSLFGVQREYAPPFQPSWLLLPA
jgi:hypothetical protein